MVTVELRTGDGHIPCIAPAKRQIPGASAPSPLTNLPAVQTVARGHPYEAWISRSPAHPMPPATHIVTTARLAPRRRPSSSA